MSVSALNSGGGGGRGEDSGLRQFAAGGETESETYGLVTSAARKSGEEGRVVKVRKVTDAASLTSQFTTGSTKVVDKLMEAYVEEQMAARHAGEAKKKGKGGEECQSAEAAPRALREEDLYAVPEAYRIKKADDVMTAIVKGAKVRAGIGIVGGGVRLKLDSKGRVADIDEELNNDTAVDKLSLTNVVEVELPLQHKIRNMQQTRELRKQLLQQASTSSSSRATAPPAVVAPSPSSTAAAASSTQKTAGYRRFRSTRDFVEQRRAKIKAHHNKDTVPLPSEQRQAKMSERDMEWAKFRAGGASDSAFASSYRKRMRNMRR